MELLEKREASRPRSLGQEGQGVVEYILLLFIVSSLGLLVFRGMDEIQLSEKILKPIREDFARAYRYGHPKGKGYQDGEPENHPRVVSSSNNNFRMFLNPSRK